LATSWPIVPPQGDYDDGEFDGMMIGKGNRSTRRKSAQVPLCPPQIIPFGMGLTEVSYVTIKPIRIKRLYLRFQAFIYDGSGSELN
jgi:hypothetical protein